MTQKTTDKIRMLNDRFRCEADGQVQGTIFITKGLAAHGEEQGNWRVEISELVSAYNDFTEDNDPHAEHDFGAFEYGGEKCFWKLDYYADESMQFGSQDPSDISKSYRVLTIMLASEY